MATRPKKTEDAASRLAEKLRFMLVGGTNTAIDFIILFVLTAFGLNKFVANIISTSAALIFSFFANKSFTFKDKTGVHRRQFAIFLVVTLFGLWALQPIVIYLSSLVVLPLVGDATIDLFIGKLLATVVTLIWNYLMYSRVVFKKSDD